ncbi:MAG: RHS repeat-associated core domain-containing protein [Pseudomonadales bacterium]
MKNSRFTIRYRWLAICASIFLLHYATQALAGNPDARRTAMQALLGVERHLLGEAQLPYNLRAQYDRAPGGGDGKLDMADLVHIEQRLLNGGDIRADPLSPGPSPDTLTTLHQYTWHDLPGITSLASHREQLVAAGRVAERASYFDTRGNMLRTVNEAGHTTELLDYNAQGLAQRIIDPNGVKTSLEYHPRGWLLSSTVHDPEKAANKLTTQYSYDDAGQLKRVIFPSGRWLDYRYDARGEVVSIRDAGGQQINYRLDATGNRLMESLCRVQTAGDANDNCVTHYEFARYYDGLDRFRRSVDGEGARRDYDYNKNGKPLLLTDANGHSQQATYNALGQLIAQASYSAQGSPHSGESSDGSSDQSSGEDSNESSGENSGDNIGDSSNSTNVDANTVAFRYGTNGFLATIEDPRGVETHFDFDAFGNTKQRQSTDVGSVSFSHDAAGNVTSQRDAAGRQQYYRYDASSRLVRVEVPGEPHKEVNYLYDQGDLSAGGGEGSGKNYASGSLVFKSDSSGSTQYRYDHRGNTTQVVNRIDDREYTLRFFYDPDDRLTGMDFPDGSELRYQHNVSGQVTAIHLNGTPIVSNVEYLPFGPAAGYTLGNGIERALQYGLDYRLEQIHESGGDFSAAQEFTYDPAGNLLQYQQSGMVESTQQFSYDALHRLLAYAGPDGSISFDYDSAGNRIARQRFNESGGLLEDLEYTYADDSNRLQMVVDTLAGGNPGQQFTHDQSGRVIGSTKPGGEGMALAYDGFGRLASITASDSTGNESTLAEYKYNADGQRVRKLANNKNWHMIYDTAGKLLARYTVSSSPAEIESVLYLYLGETRVARVLGSAVGQSVEYYHNDHLGRPWALSNASGAMVWHAKYSPFGNRTVLLAQTQEQVHGLPGQVFDSESGLWYNYHRDYDSATGRYLQSDPLGPAGGLNTYAYAGGNPLRFTDPYGLFFFGPVCGSGANARFVPDGPFTDACRKHDECYGDCSKSKEQCDLELCTNGACLYGFLLSSVFDGASGDAYDDAQKECDDCEQGP